MDQNNVKSVNAVNVADDFLKTDLPSNRKESELTVLKDWELVLASGGDALVCW